MHSYNVIYFLGGIDPLLGGLYQMEIIYSFALSFL